MDKGWAAAQAKHADLQEQQQARIEDLADAIEEADELDEASNSVVDLSLGNVYQTRGDLAQAESSLLVHLQLYEVLGSKEGMAAAYGNLGIVYHTLGDLAQASAMYKESIALFQQFGATPRVQQLQELLDNSRSRAPRPRQGNSAYINRPRLTLFNDRPQSAMRGATQRGKSWNQKPTSCES